MRYPMNCRLLSSLFLFIVFKNLGQRTLINTHLGGHPAGITIYCTSYPSYVGMPQLVITLIMKINDILNKLDGFDH